MKQPDDLTSLRDQILENQKVIDELNRNLARKTRDVRIIQQLSYEITATLSLGEILEILLKSLDQVLGFKHSMILLLDGNGEKLKVAASRGYADAGLGAEVAVGTGVVGVVAKKKKILRMGNIAGQLSYTGAVRAGMQQAGQGGKLDEVAAMPGLKQVRSQIAIPLLIKDRLIGVCAVESEQQGAFDELDEVLLGILANQAAAAIENARLYQSEEAQALELREAQQALTLANENLEMKVKQRTAELEKAHEVVSGALKQVEFEKHRSQELLGRMAPPEVVPLMLEGKLLARKLQATILFTDLEGFTQYSSGMEPDELFTKLNHYFSRAGAHIKKYRGYVNKTNGDSIMALFGVPYENTTHALDAVLSALAMQKELYQDFALNMRIGINTGPITAGILGPSDKSLYDVLGDAANLASRMEKICPPGSVTISEQTCNLVSAHFEIKPLGKQKVKGKGSLPCYEVVGVRKLMDDQRRIDPSSLFARSYNALPGELERIKESRFSNVDFLSIQARDGALRHNEAAACFSLALLRFLKSPDCKVPGREAILPALEKVGEEDLVSLALTHDLGKHALDSARLNDPNLSLPELERLRAELQDQTFKAISQIGLASLQAPLAKLYLFEQSKGHQAPGDALTWIVAAADMYDALTAPKIYKGRGWSIAGSLEELLSIPPTQPEQYAVFKAFAELMRPENSVLSERKRSGVLFQ